MRATLHEHDCEVEAFSPDSRLPAMRNRAIDIVSLYDLRSAALVGRVTFSRYQDAQSRFSDQAFQQYLQSGQFPGGAR